MSSAMWQWLKHWLTGKGSIIVPLPDAIRVCEEGVYYRAWTSQPEQLWPWEILREFGLSVHQAIYPDPWFGEYMEAQWFITVQDSDGPRRLFFEVDQLSMDSLPAILFEKLPGFDKNVLRTGWQHYQAGPKNYEGAGQWLAWQKKGFMWGQHQAL
jgi:hypothetical protein